MFYSKLCLVPN